MFLNRLKRGMPLQADPTVLYGRTDGDRRITRADLARPTPVQHLHHAGPAADADRQPRARGARGGGAIRRTVPYLYFVARGDGSHEFNVELAQHNAAVVARLRHARARRAAERRRQVPGSGGAGWS